ncbi:unnamed protein product [Thelazia callipaeda]|uniref:ubiquitinyl hydrolase 1 n=1 Tax=Thelazia callipaeda TaxID=103827 RepID=A0A0N5D8K6_THECL|nr:unnamed protein product [Thelazia callipaeda]
MVLKRSGTIRLADLRFDSLEHLKSWCDANHKQKWEQTIGRLTSCKAFDHAERVYDEARLKMKEGDEEDAYKLFMRMGIISKLIISKNDFDDFKNSPVVISIDDKIDSISSETQLNGRRLYHLFEQCIGFMNELEESLIKRYELKNVEKSYSEKNVDIMQHDGANKHEVDLTDDSLVIDPRDLVRYISSKHQALIIDYRSDQTDIIQYTSGNQLMVAQVPADAVVPGCIGSSLIRSAEIGQRVLLQRMADVDIVVLMGSDRAPIDEKNMVAGSKEQILYSALSTVLLHQIDNSMNAQYNNNFRLKNPPKFLKGGFESWRLYYPMHTSTKSAVRKKFIDIAASRTEFAKAVAEYKKDYGIDSLEYPQLLSASHSKPNQSPHSSISDSAIHHRKGSESNAVAASEIVTDPKHICGADETSDDKRNDVVPASAANEPPLIDRSKKPSRQTSIKDKSKSPIKKSTRVVAGGAKFCDKNLRSRSAVTMPNVPDRLLKPQASQKDIEEKLLQLYGSMLNILSSSGVSRNCCPGYTGFYNLENTCFMNAVLQALLNTAPLRKIFTKDKFMKYVNRYYFNAKQNNRVGTMGVISSAFSALMDTAWSGMYSVLRPQQFLETFAAEVNASLANGQQHDAQEFQIYLLDALHEDTNRVVKRISFEQNYTGENLKAEAADYREKLKDFASSPISDTFNCQTMSSLQCNKCKRQSVTFEELVQLSVEVPDKNLALLEDCIRNHFQDVELDGSCKWRCPDCQSLQSATRKMLLWKLPLILVIHLKRFTFIGDRWQKNNINVRFDTLRLELQNEYYNLYAVVNHKGNLNSGHYTCMVRNQNRNQWLLFDDDVVTPIDVGSVCTKYAFILYFEKDSPAKTTTL